MTSTLEKLKAIVENRDPEGLDVAPQSKPHETSTHHEETSTPLQIVEPEPESTPLRSEEVDKSESSNSERDGIESHAELEERSFREQLESLYQDLAHLNEQFPGHDLNSLIDYTKSLEEKLGCDPRTEHVLSYDNYRTALAQLTADQADRAAFGIIELSDQGRILIYNRWQSQLSGMSAEKTIGRHFFLEIAPCTNNRLVFGRFKQGLSSGELDVKFAYCFSYRMNPTNVELHLIRDPDSQRNYLIVQRATTV